MLTITLRDLRARRRQFAIAIVGAGLVFCLALVLTGVRAGFRTEAETTVTDAGADEWVVPAGVTGPFTSLSTLDATLADEIRGRGGVRAASPVVAMQHALRHEGEPLSVNVLGHERGGLGEPAVARGRTAERAGEAVVDDALGIPLDGRISIADRRLRVVGITEDRTYLGGVPVLFLTLPDAQAVAFDGRSLANAIAVSGRTGPLPSGTELRSNDDVREDLVRPLEGATGAIDILRVLMWIVAAVIIGAVTYLSALERVRDFAVLKAVGAASRTLAASLGAEALVASLLAAAIAAGVAAAIAPAFPLPVTITGTTYLGLIAVAVVIGLVASFAALRRAIGVDPALAFRD